MTDSEPTPEQSEPSIHRWPRSVYGVGAEPDPRFSLANERTFLAWIRTGLGFLTAGVGVAALHNYLPDLAVEAQLIAVVLVLTGVVVGLVAFRRWATQERAMRLKRPLSGSLMMPVFSLVLVLVALIAVTILIRS